MMKVLLPGQKTERKVFYSSNWPCRTGLGIFYNIPFKNMKSMMTQCLQIAHEQGRKMDSELEAECLKTVFNCDYFWSKWNITDDRKSSDLITEIKFVRIVYHDDFLYPRIQHHSLNQFQFWEMKNLPHKKVTPILIPGIQLIHWDWIKIPVISRQFYVHVLVWQN